LINEFEKDDSRSYHSNEVIIVIQGLYRGLKIAQRIQVEVGFSVFLI